MGFNSTTILLLVAVPIVLVILIGLSAFKGADWFKALTAPLRKVSPLLRHSSRSEKSSVDSVDLEKEVGSSSRRQASS